MDDRRRNEGISDSHRRRRKKSIAFPQRSAKAGVDRTRALRSGSGRHQFRVSLPGYMISSSAQTCPPVSNGHGPFFSSAPRSPDRTPGSASWRWERPCGRGLASGTRRAEETRIIKKLLTEYQDILLKEAMERVANGRKTCENFLHSGMGFFIKKSCNFTSDGKSTTS